LEVSVYVIHDDPKRAPVRVFRWQPEGTPAAQHNLTVHVSPATLTSGP
jgi:hypothetical protein